MKESKWKIGYSVAYNRKACTVKAIRESVIHGFVYDLESTDFDDAGVFETEQDIPEAMLQSVRIIVF